MEYFVISFIAGILTILAPCVLPMLPVILGGSIGAKSLTRPAIIILSLAISILAFTLILKLFFVGVPETALKLLSSGIIFIFGLFLIFPHLWEKISVVLKLGNSAQALLQKSSQKKGVWGAILLGASLGPVFSACSPTYFLIVGTILPQDFWIGFMNLLIYAAGIFVGLFPIALFGQKFISKIKWAADGEGLFKKIMGFIFVLLAVAIFMGWDKKIEAKILDAGYFGALEIEQKLLKQ